MKILKKQLKVAALFLNLCSSHYIFSDSYDTHLSIDSSGNSTLLWQLSGPTGSIIQSSTLLSGSKEWSSSITLSDGDSSNSPSFAMNTSGDGVAIWKTFDKNLNGYSLSASIYHNGSWSDSKNISGSENPVLSNCKVKINESGKIIAIWSCFYSTDSVDTEVYGATADATVGNSSWSSPMSIIQ